MANAEHQPITEFGGWAPAGSRAKLLVRGVKALPEVEFAESIFSFRSANEAQICPRSVIR